MGAGALSAKQSDSDALKEPGIRGVVGILTDYCMDIAKGWGVKRVIAITTTDNPRMVSVFRKRGFEIKPDPDGSTVDVSKDL